MGVVGLWLWQDIAKWPCFRPVIKHGMAANTRWDRCGLGWGDAKGGTITARYGARACWSVGFSSKAAIAWYYLVLQPEAGFRKVSLEAVLHVLQP